MSDIFAQEIAEMEAPYHRCVGKISSLAEETKEEMKRLVCYILSELGLGTHSQNFPAISELPEDWTARILVNQLNFVQLRNVLSILLEKSFPRDGVIQNRDLAEKLLKFRVRILKNSNDIIEIRNVLSHSRLCRGEEVSNRFDDTVELTEKPITMIIDSNRKDDNFLTNYFVLYLLRLESSINTISKFNAFLFWVSSEIYDTSLEACFWDSEHSEFLEKYEEYSDVIENNIEMPWHGTLFHRGRSLNREELYELDV
jgi:hypothetical protein